jgi:hypothetical protein
MDEENVARIAVGCGPDALGESLRDRCHISQISPVRFDHDSTREIADQSAKDCQ